MSLRQHKYHFLAAAQQYNLRQRHLVRRRVEDHAKKIKESFTSKLKQFASNVSNDIHKNQISGTEIMEHRLFHCETGRQGTGREQFGIIL